jgi:predicted nucleic acid-binding Zn ribbon protein
LWEIKQADPVYWRQLRDPIFAKVTDAEGYITCPRCKLRSKSAIRFQIDHIEPMAKGGKTVPDNLQVLCRTCNGKKGSKPRGHCVKCGTMVEMDNVKSGVTFDGYGWVTGHCTHCHTWISKLLSDNTTRQSKPRGHCVKCGKMVEMDNVESGELFDGYGWETGNCADCGTWVSTLL